MILELLLSELLHITTCRCQKILSSIIIRFERTKNRPHLNYEDHCSMGICTIVCWASYKTLHKAQHPRVSDPAGLNQCSYASCWLAESHVCTRIAHLHRRTLWNQNVQITTQPLQHITYFTLLGTFWFYVQRLGSPPFIVLIAQKRNILSDNCKLLYLWPFINCLLVRSSK